jgi:hypothetical protein
MTQAQLRKCALSVPEEAMSNIQVLDKLDHDTLLEIMFMNPEHSLLYEYTYKRLTNEEIENLVLKCEHDIFLCSSLVLNRVSDSTILKINSRFPHASEQYPHFLEKLQKLGKEK